MSFLQTACSQPGAQGPLQLMYGIDGRRELPEESLEHLAGYRGSRPVRIGNGAYDQLQLGIYGELIDSIYVYDKYGAPIAHDTWGAVRTLADLGDRQLAAGGRRIWEVRGGRRHFVYSKIMCWVALDRTVRIAQRRSLPGDTGRWAKLRDAIYEEIMHKGWDESRRAFVQSYGSKQLDASTLMMPLVLFL